MAAAYNDDGGHETQLVVSVRRYDVIVCYVL